MRRLEGISTPQLRSSAPRPFGSAGEAPLGGPWRPPPRPAPRPAGPHEQRPPPKRDTEFKPYQLKPKRDTKVEPPIAELPPSTKALGPQYNGGPWALLRGVPHKQRSKEAKTNEEKVR